MKYRILGRTGLEVSEIGLGGEWLERQSAESVKSMIDRAAEFGINILDCFMSNPEVRDRIGAAIAPRREKWVVQGHLCSVWENGQYGKSRDMKKVKFFFEDLLCRMKTDYIDVGMIHYVDTPDEYDAVVRDGVFDYARRLKEEGKIRYIGLSSHDARTAKMAAASGWVDVILFSVNPAFDLLPSNTDIMSMFEEAVYADPKLGGAIQPERDDFYRFCDREGVALTVMKCYGGGNLLKEKSSPFGVALTPLQCIHYALTRPAVASVLAGFSEPKHIDEAVAYETAPPESLDYASVLACAPKHAYSGQCLYCGHCAPCPVKIDVAMVNKLADLASFSNEIPGTIREHYKGLVRHASDCMACGQCEKRCPFGVPVAERMRAAAARFGL